MRVALVTGAARNIGFAIAQALAADGMAVAVNGRDPDAVGDACERLTAAGATAIAAPGDISTEDGVAEVVNAAASLNGHVDVLVNNAGVRAHGPLVDTATEDWQQVIDTVLTGAFLTTRAVLGGMRERGWGRIINIAGMSGQSGAANRVAVVSAKSGLIGFTKAAALEGAAEGVTVNAISPGLIDTKRPPTLGDASYAQAHYTAVQDTVPIGRLGDVAEVAALCTFLCSEQAGFITGQVLSINGGARM
jgi:NAD(P)-dependent dehydrogenase (short-subunit alcohol dehydrogenase family)